MKVAVIGDTHAGMRKDSPKFHAHAEKFFQEFFFPYIKEHGVNTVIQTGDLFDSRKSINPYTSNLFKKYFLNEFSTESGLKLYTILGNHDIYWKESLDVNTPSELIPSHLNIEIIDKATSISIGGTFIDFIPWICASNFTDTMNYIEKSASPYCVGHFEITNAKMYRGSECHGGMDVSFLYGYNKVISGHFHTRSIYNNVVYVGTPYEITWEDCGDPRGFHIFDTETGDLEFIENPHRIFSVISYNDGDHDDISDIANKFVRLQVKSKSNLYEFENFVSRLNSSGAYEVKIIDIMSVTVTGEISGDIKVADTMSIVSDYISHSDIKNKEQVEMYIRTLYTQVLNSEVA